MGKYRKKPIIIEAFQNGFDEKPEWFEDAVADGTIRIVGDEVVITTLEGTMTAKLGDWIIKEPFGTDNRKYYPCKPDIFERTYENVSEEKGLDK